MNSIEKSKEFKKLLVKHKTRAESRFIKLLKEISIPYTFQKEWIEEGGFYISDFYLTTKEGKGITIELDGEYHNDPEQKKRDKKKAKWLKSIDILTYRLSNDKVTWMSTQDLKVFLKRRKVL